MSDTERLEAAARVFDRRAELNDTPRAPSNYKKTAAEDRAVAALLRAARPWVGSVHAVAHDQACPSCLLVEGALAVADAVLGVPASPKEQTDA